MWDAGEAVIGMGLEGILEVVGMFCVSEWLVVTWVNVQRFIKEVLGRGQ